MLKNSNLLFWIVLVFKQLFPDECCLPYFVLTAPGGRHVEDHQVTREAGGVDLVVEDLSALPSHLVSGVLKILGEAQLGLGIFLAEEVAPTQVIGHQSEEEAAVPRSERGHVPGPRGRWAARL